MVSDAPVSSTSRTTECPFGPAMVASMTIRSPSSSNEVPDLIRHHDSGEVRDRHSELACEEMPDHGVRRPPCIDLRQGLPPRPAVANDSRGADRCAVRFALDLDHAYPLVGISLPDLGPGPWFRDPGLDPLGSAHMADLRQCLAAVKFSANPCRARALERRSRRPRIEQNRRRETRVVLVCGSAGRTIRRCSETRDRTVVAARADPARRASPGCAASGC